MKAEILTVGTEILLGDILNTNTRFLSRELAAMGIGIYRQTTVGDNRERLLKALGDAFQYSDMVITTGGLGPTSDDITKEVCAEYFGQKLVIHEKSKEELEKYFAGKENAMESNLKQAMFPENSVILSNPNGTAPGCIMTDGNDKYIIVLPGPPKEMEPMFENEVRPFLQKLSGNVIISEIMRFMNIGEWEMAVKVKDLTDSSENPTVAPYAKDGECILRITAMADTAEKCWDLIEPVTEEIINRMPDNFYGFGEKTLEELVPELLIGKKLTISTAESLTGGLLASAFIDSDKGISSSFMEGLITYSNESKIKELGVSEETLEKKGAVSSECAIEMAQGLKKRTGTDIAVSTTGIAGPTGGSEEKPVGLTYMAIIYKDKEIVWREEFRGSRNRIRRRTVRSVLSKLLRFLEEDTESENMEE